jgi:hypothetical protein
VELGPDWQPLRRHCAALHAAVAWLLWGGVMVGTYLFYTRVLLVRSASAPAPLHSPWWEVRLCGFGLMCLPAGLWAITRAAMGYEELGASAVILRVCAIVLLLSTEFAVFTCVFPQETEPLPTIFAIGVGALVLPLFTYVLVAAMSRH